MHKINRMTLETEEGLVIHALTDESGTFHIVRIESEITNWDLGDLLRIEGNKVISKGVTQ